MTGNRELAVVNSEWLPLLTESSFSIQGAKKHGVGDEFGANSTTFDSVSSEDVTANELKMMEMDFDARFEAVSSKVGIVYLISNLLYLHSLDLDFLAGSEEG